MRFDFAILLVFWCASLGVTVLQQSSLLSEVHELWASRYETERRAAERMEKLSSSIAMSFNNNNNNNERRQQRLRTSSSSSLSSGNYSSAASLLESLRQIEDNTRFDFETFSRKMKRKLDAAAMMMKQKKKNSQQSSNKNNRKEAQNKLKPMRTACQDYETNQAIHRLVTAVRNKLYEPDARGLLSDYTSGRYGGGGALDQIRMDAQLSSLDADIEAVLDHLEQTMPKILEKWSKWFAEDGSPHPAPKFLPLSKGAEVHSSDEAGREAYQREVEARRKNKHFT